MDRFASSNQQNIQNLIQKSKNENTTRATNQWMRVYHSWAQQRNAPLDIELLPPSELDPLLQTFYAEIRKQNGKDYEPSCLANMLSCIDRYLKESNTNSQSFEIENFQRQNLSLKERPGF